MSTTCCACFASTTVLMSNGFALISSSLHYNLAGHLRVNGTEVGKRSGLGKRIRELFVGIQYLGLEHALGADHRVRDVIVVGPDDGRSDRDGQRLGPKTEIVDLHLSRCCR